MVSLRSFPSITEVSALWHMVGTLGVAAGLKMACVWTALQAL
jgi:hypothetical protein